MKINARFGLALATTAVLLPAALSATGESVATIRFLSILCLPILLAAGLAWTRGTAGAARPRIRAQKRVLVAVGIALLALTPLTNWPLRLSFALAHPQVTRAVAAGYADAQRDFDTRFNTSGLPYLYFDHYSSWTLRPQPVAGHLGMFSPSNITPVPHSGATIALRNVGADRSWLVYALPEGDESDRPAIDPAPYTRSDILNLGDGWWFVSER